VLAVADIVAPWLGEPWQIRAVAIEPDAGGWLELRDGEIIDSTRDE
jgi:hypothetical protein